METSEASSTSGRVVERQMRRSQRQRFLRLANENFVWILVLLVAAGAAFYQPIFLRPRNLLNILVAVSFLGCLVLAQAVVLIAGHFNLATEATMIFLVVLVGVLMAPAAFVTQSDGVTIVNVGGLGIPWVAALVGILALASLLGLVMGLMLTKLRMNPFMVTLGMSIVLEGAALTVGSGRQQTNLPAGFRWVGSHRIGLVPVSAVFLLLLLALMHFVLARTVFGRQLYAVGSNRQAARAVGINDEWVIIKAFVLSGLFSGLAAFVLAGRLGATSLGISRGALFISFAAAVVGGVSLYGGRGTVAGMLGGLLLLGVITNVLNLSNISGFLTTLIQGLIIVAAVFIDSLRVRIG